MRLCQIALWAKLLISIYRRKSARSTFLNAFHFLLIGNRFWLLWTYRRDVVMSRESQAMLVRTITSVSAAAETSCSTCFRRTAPEVLRHGLLIAVLVLTSLLFIVIDGRILFPRTRTGNKDYLRTFPGAIGLSSLSSMSKTNISGGCPPLNQNGEVAALSPTLMDGEMWCVLEKNNTHQFKHFPHASESLLACWSWFQRTRESAASGSNMSCGFYLKPDLNKPSRWTAELIKLMGCSVTYNQPPCCTSNKNKKTMIFHHDEILGGGRYWFEKPDDATVLRSRLLDHQASSTWNRPRFRSHQQQQRITIINRKGTRRLVNSENISTALREAYPSALIQTVYMEDMEPMEQFVLWSKQSIVIAPHGAGLTNAIFLPPGNASAVIEIFPPHYYQHFYFGGLLRSCGIRRYGYYYNESDPAADWKVYGSTKEQRRFYRSVDLEPPVDDILGLVRKAVIDGESNIYTTNF
jgi:Glycosyltransferase 61